MDGIATEGLAKVAIFATIFAMDPAQTIIDKLGGPTLVAGIVGIHRTRVSSWQRSRETGGTDGRVPQNHIPVLLEYARKHGIELTAEDFLRASARDKSRRAKKKRAGALVVAAPPRPGFRPGVNRTRGLPAVFGGSSLIRRLL